MQQRPRPRGARQRLVWARQRQLNVLRSTLRAFGTDLADRDALAVPAIAPTCGCQKLDRGL